MIQILDLEIEEFRGIRHLKLRLDGKSFAIHGPNGSGKSGVVDAIGFGLTGTIARLSGAGTAGISVQRHGPHVHKRDDPAASWVKLTFRDTVSGQTGTILRSVKSPGTFKLTPDTAELRTALDILRQHPELTLSRREIIKFILAESGRRASEVQALLQLDRVGNQRKSLKSCLTKLGQNETATQTVLDTARGSVSRHFDIPKLVPDELVKIANEKRATLGLEKFETLSFETDFKAGIEDKTTDVPFDKPSALRDVQALHGRRSDTTGLESQLTDLSAALAAFDDDVAVLESLKHRSFVASGLALIEDAVCPLCDTQWDSPDELRRHLQEKIDLSQEAARREQILKKVAASVVDTIRAERETIKPVQRLAASWGTPEVQSALQEWHDKLLAVETQLGSIPGIVSQRDAIQAGLVKPPAELAAEMEGLAKILDAKPDTSAKSAAQNFLVIAAERWTVLRRARQDRDLARQTHKLAESVYKKYCDLADHALTQLYDDVEARFSRFYSRINADDESSFKAELESSAGSLDLRVDFYGLGMFPPGAYHSEGHQDGMGVCLYLALVEKLLGAGFQFAVLDDVVMSVDSNHRRQFCELLKTEFPGVQFVITTHDEVWAKQMQASGLIGKGAQVRFRGWTVDAGPASEQGADFWDKIAEDLDRNEMPSAAATLRRGLEAELPDIAEELRARVAYRGDAKYELGDLLSAIMGRHGEWLKKAANAANSWNNQESKTRVQKLKAERETVTLVQQEENWAVNALVHYNGWASMTKADFAPVVAAWREFLKLFQCDNEECGSWIMVTGQPGNEDALRCRCGEYSLNLLTKPKT
jgi:AAA domain